MIGFMEKLASSFVNHKIFKQLIVLLIILSAIIIGIETYSGFAEKYREILLKADKLIIYVFVIEILLKLLSYGKNPLKFFSDPWNVFDFIVIGICLIPFGDTHFIAVLRIARILRVLRMVSLFPRLQLLVGALLKSIPSMGYVILLLSLLLFVYAITGSFLFGPADPERFGNLHLSSITLFKVLTLEGWTEILDSHLFKNKIVNGTAVSVLSPWALLYFISFILLGAMIILNLFIGVIMKSMEETQGEIDRKLSEIKNAESKSEDIILSIESKLGEIQKELADLKDKFRKT